MKKMQNDLSRFGQMELTDKELSSVLGAGPGGPPRPPQGAGEIAMQNNGEIKFDEFGNPIPTEPFVP